MSLLKAIFSAAAIAGILPHAHAFTYSELDACILACAEMNFDQVNPRCNSVVAATSDQRTQAAKQWVYRSSQSAESTCGSGPAAGLSNANSLIARTNYRCGPNTRYFGPLAQVFSGVSQQCQTRYESLARRTQSRGKSDGPVAPATTVKPRPSSSNAR